MHKRILALGRMKKGEMNKTEAAYAGYLEAQKIAGKLVWYEFEPITLRLANRTSYTPDFLVLRDDGVLECHEVKGFWRDDAKVKTKIAAEKFPFRFVVIRKVKGGWDFEEF
jgi:hypothetical protein